MTQTEISRPFFCASCFPSLIAQDRPDGPSADDQHDHIHITSRGVWAVSDMVRSPKIPALGPCGYVCRVSQIRATKIKAPFEGPKQNCVSESPGVMLYPVTPGPGVGTNPIFVA